jgi:DNA invertase Pin-like site-specific DNA recombinase
MRAAQYVRVSTEHQQYSILNQQTAIADYATIHDYQIVKTYADPAKSGLDIKRRPGLRALIDDVLNGKADVQAVLVFDVSRWGRFQDSDEAACYEFLCKRAGIQVHYCAEAFSNDGSLASAFLKMVKRTMAAEYLRELSAKVHAGQCRVAAHGFKCGGRAGYGLGRLLLDASGLPKSILRDGERKNLATERVVYTLGPDEEVSIVRQVYSMFLEQDLSAPKIARQLNDLGIRRVGCGPWNAGAVYRILTHLKYAGYVVFNRTSETLRSKRVRNPREQWVLRPASFPAIVSQDTFDRAQTKLQALVNRRSNEQLLVELSALAAKFGKVTPRLLQSAQGVASTSTYQARFGSLMRAYALIRYTGARYSASSLECRRHIAGLKANAIAELDQALIDARMAFIRKGPVFQLHGCGYFDLVIGRSFSLGNGQLRWAVKAWKNCLGHGLVVVRLQPGNFSVQDFVVLPNNPEGFVYFTLSDSMVRSSGITCGSVADAVTAISVLSVR